MRFQASLGLALKVEGIQPPSGVPVGGTRASCLEPVPPGLLSGLAPTSQGTSPSLGEKARLTRAPSGGVSGSLQQP